MKRVVVLGCTGSIGVQTLKVIKELNYKVVGLGCKSNKRMLFEQMKEYDCKAAALIDGNGEVEFCGDEAFDNLCDNVDFDILVAGSSGLSALKPTLKALNNRKRVALANKEIAVCAGELLKAAAKNGELIPVDSEHSALFQCLETTKDIKNVTITCSGGALRDYPIDRLDQVTCEQVLAHPNWKMGAKITVDCATMANKAFEVIEAVNLFGLDYEQVKVLIHKESLVHGFVTTKDGSIIAQVAHPSMTMPIRYALTYPQRVDSNQETNLAGKTMTFEEYDEKRYPLFKIILSESKKSPQNAAFFAGVDEGVVNLFLKGAIKYSQIHIIIEKSLDYLPKKTIKTPQDAIDIYHSGLRWANEYKV